MTKTEQSQENPTKPMQKLGPCGHPSEFEIHNCWRIKVAKNSVPNFHEELILILASGGLDNKGEDGPEYEVWCICANVDCTDAARKSVTELAKKYHTI